MIRELTGKVYREVIDKEKSCVIVFSSTFCAQCFPLKEKVSRYSSLVDIYIGDIRNNEVSEIATENNILAVPTVLFMKNGQEVGRLIGNMRDSVIEDGVNYIREK